MCIRDSNFADPIDLDTFLKDHVSDEYSISSPQEKPEWLTDVTVKLGQSVIRAINNSVAVTSTSLFSVALLTSSTQTMDEDDLEERINFFISLIEKSSDYKDVWITQREVKDIISKTEKLGFIEPTMTVSYTHLTLPTKRIV